MRLPLAALLAALASTAGAETLTILHTNDVHSRLEPVSRFNTTCSPDQVAEGACQGGAARLLAAINVARDEAGAVLLLDGGDQFQGSLMYTQYKGKAAAEVMNVLGYDAMAVGNHEFDDGPEVLRAFIDAVDFPVLMANADVSAEPSLAGAVPPSVVLERGGHRYGLIGLAPADTHETSKPGPTVVFEDPVVALQREVARLEADGINRIIVLSHSGYSADKQFAAAVDGIDVIIGGHSHTLLSNQVDGAAGPYPTWVTTPSGGRTAIVQAYAYARYLGRLEVAFDVKGLLTQASGEPIFLGPGSPEDPKLAARVAALAEPLNALRQEVVAEATAMIGADHGQCRARECTLGTMVADAMLARVRRQGVEIAIQNGGGLRAPLPAGEITRGDVMEMLPFQNTLSLLSLTGADLRAALAHGISAVADGHGRFPQVAGMRFAYDTSANGGTPRLGAVEVYRDGAWAPLDDARTYDVVTNDFLRRGGDGYEVFAERAVRPYDFGPDLVDVVIDYLSRKRPYTPYTDGRIRVD
ncbi:MAG: bifunctional metallophosphatase/5'-nucleotidase [Pseudomonadota bacterium]